MTVALVAGIANPNAARLAGLHTTAEHAEQALARPRLAEAVRAYTLAVKQIASGRITQAAVKYTENAPMATACCNACRTCITTNVVGIAVAVITGSGIRFRRALGRGSGLS
jgi:hypothetical protein